MNWIGISIENVIFAGPFKQDQEERDAAWRTREGSGKSETMNGICTAFFGQIRFQEKWEDGRNDRGQHGIREATRESMAESSPAYFHGAGYC